MASGKPLSCNKKLITIHRPRPSSMLLKDYLRDDLSSCSSSSFKSFPRRQCYTTVRFLLEKDLQPPGSNKKRASPKLSTLQIAVKNVVKLLPFCSSSSSPSLSRKDKSSKSLQCRNLSRKLLSKRFWRISKTLKKEGSETRWWRPFRELLEERDKPLDQKDRANRNATVFSCWLSSSNSENSKSYRNGWRESEFSSDILRSSSGNYESSTENEVVESKNCTAEKEAAKEVVVVTVGEESMEGKTSSKASLSNTITMDWPNEEKEQFSPVSVLECPFEDDEDSISSSFNSEFPHLEGGKHKHMQKTRHFDRTASLKPLNLEKRLIQSELHDKPHKSPRTPYSAASTMSIAKNDNNEENGIQEEAWHLLNMAQRSNSSNCFNNLLLDFFTEGIEDAKKQQLLKVAEDWINGEAQGLYLGWEVEEGRQIYLKEMDKCRSRWRKFDQEKKQVATDLEFEVFTHLVNELVVDLMSC